MKLRANDLRAIADKLDQLSTMDIDISEFRLSNGITCKVAKEMVGQRREETQYYLAGIAEQFTDRDR